MEERIKFEWIYQKKKYEKELDKSAFTILMEAIKLNYPYNNMIASQMTEVLPNTAKIVVDRNRAEEDSEHAFILCVLKDGTIKTIQALLTNKIIWGMFREWGEGK